MIVKVLVENYIKKTDSVLSYRVPSNFESNIQIGKRVKVPLNKSIIEGFIIGIAEKNDVNYELKDIIEVVDQYQILDDELMKLGEYIKSTTLCSLISAYQVMLPTALKAKHKSNIKSKYDKYVKLSCSINCVSDYIKSYPRRKKHATLLKQLTEQSEVLIDSFNKITAKELYSLGMVSYVSHQVYRSLNNNYSEYNKLELNKEQRDVVLEVKKNIDKPITYLLHGVCGSGKTESYLQIIEYVLSLGKDVIVLVPEISLTPQIVSRFKGRFGDNVAVLHSSLSNPEKYDEWIRLKRGEAHIVVGARSAIFAPLSNLGLIVIDEEHESTYKQESNPKYHALDIAKFRSNYHSCPIILGSATPSLESYARAEKHVYKLLELKSRANNKPLPNVEIVDMVKEIKKKNNIISSLLKSKIEERLNKNEQVILLLNKRGYSSFVTCHDCGYIEKCPACDITLTYHKTSNTLRCHYCGYGTKMNDKCPKCGGKINNYGSGTEKVYEVLSDMFKNASIVRMDLDTTTKKGSHEKIISDFENHKYDILLGTQMIAKGLDFGNVTLVGVINADTSLNLPDFRSGEKTFQLLSQVSGRAGRADRIGEVIIQTYNKDNYSINYASRHDYLGFYNYEMNLRKKLKYSPYYYLVSIKILGRVYDDVKVEALKIKKFLESNISHDTIILGPTTASVFKLNNIYRFQIILKYKRDDKLLGTLSTLEKLYINKKIDIDIDFNPIF